MRPKVVATRALPGDGAMRLASVADVDMWPEPRPPTPAELAELVACADGVVSMLTEAIGPELLESAPQIRAVSNVAVGLDNISLEACTARGIPVGHTPGVLTNATADLTWALILAAARRLFEAGQAVKAGEWPPFTPTWMCGIEMDGATLGIVGRGAIGSAVAARAEAFGMNVVFARHRGGDGLPLDELLATSDVVSLHCPLTDATRGLIGERELALMKSTAILINTARGPIVDEGALVNALRTGVIWAAGLDVTTVEPLDPASPLLGLANATVLPHIGSATIQTRTRMADLAVDNMIAALEGRRMTHCANPAVYG